MKNGSLGVGALAGFVLMGLLWWLPIIGPLLSGLVAGLIARGLGRGLVAGLIAGVAWGLLFSFFGIVAVGVMMMPGMTQMLGWFLGAWLFAAILFNVLLVALGGLIGGALRG